MKMNQSWKLLVTLPSLLGVSLVIAPLPGKAEGSPIVVQTSEAQTVTEPPVALPDAANSAIVATNDSGPLSTHAADLQTAPSPTPQAQTWQPETSQFAAQTITPSDNRGAVASSKLDEVAADLTTSAPTITFPSSPGIDQMVLASQDLIGCRVGNIACPSPNPARFVPPAGSTTGQTESPTQPAPTTPTATRPDRWHFLFTPIIYVPISIYGNATIRGFDANISLGPSQVFSSIRNTLQFAFFGRAEAWTPNYRLGFILGGDYLAAGQKNTFTRPNSGRLTEIVINRVANQIQGQLTDSQRQQIADVVQNSGLTNEQIRERIQQVVGQRVDQVIPSEVRSNVKVQTWSVDLAAAYRFYNPALVNPKGVESEFDLGPIVFDVFGGLRLGGTSGQVDVSGNLGREGNFSQSVFNATPLLGLRLRYNAAHNLAFVAAGSGSGFGINSLWQWSALGGLDWMFSGNTSLGVGWRFGGFSYNTGSGRNAFGGNINNNGPYLNFTFRF